MTVRPLGDPLDIDGRHAASNAKAIGGLPQAFLANKQLVGCFCGGVDHETPAWESSAGLATGMVGEDRGAPTEELHPRVHWRPLFRTAHPSATAVVRRPPAQLNHLISALQGSLGSQGRPPFPSGPALGALARFWSPAWPPPLSPCPRWEPRRPHLHAVAPTPRHSSVWAATLAHCSTPSSPELGMLGRQCP
jgi:hypothetical protein